MQLVASMLDTQIENTSVIAENSGEAAMQHRSVDLEKYDEEFNFKCDGKPLMDFEQWSDMTYFILNEQTSTWNLSLAKVKKKTTRHKWK